MYTLNFFERLVCIESTRQYFSPKGNVIHGKGVEPDLVVEPGKAGEDPQLEAAKALF